MGIIMRLARTLVCVSMAAASSHAVAGRPSEAELSVVGEACQQEGARTLLAFRGRQEGIPEAAFAARLPPLTAVSPRHVVAAHRILDDVYRLKDLSDDTLYFYRFQVCRVESVSGADIETSPAIEKSLRACEEKGVTDKEALQSCTFKAVLAAIPG